MCRNRCASFRFNEIWVIIYTLHTDFRSIAMNANVLIIDSIRKLSTGTVLVPFNSSTQLYYINFPFGLVDELSTMCIHKTQIIRYHFISFNCHYFGFQLLIVWYCSKFEIHFWRAIARRPLSPMSNGPYATSMQVNISYESIGKSNENISIKF